MAQYPNWYHESTRCGPFLAEHPKRYMYQSHLFNLKGQPCPFNKGVPQGFKQHQFIGFLGHPWVL